jgi:hypothetical protein
MSASASVAATLSSNVRKSIAIQSLSTQEPISHLAAQQGVSRKLVYEQKRKVAKAIDQAFAPSTKNPDVLFHLPVTEAWLTQLKLGLILICHSSYRGVKELLWDLFGVSISEGTIHNRLQSAAERAAAINRSPALSPIRVGLHDEMQASMRGRLIAISWRAPSIETPTPGACICWTLRRKDFIPTAPSPMRRKDFGPVRRRRWETTSLATAMSSTFNSNTKACVTCLRVWRKARLHGGRSSRRRWRKRKPGKRTLTRR